MPEATGHFDVAMEQLEVHDMAPTGLGRMSIAKTFIGDIDGVSHGEMVSNYDPSSEAAAYVALEHVEGTVHGKSGGFWLQHKATMFNGEGHMDITVVAGLSTGELAGMTGSMTIDVENNHAYVLNYTFGTD